MIMEKGQYIFVESGTAFFYKKQLGEIAYKERDI